jgi:hypothetical protein
MATNELNAMAETALRQAGWYPARAVDVAPYCTYWESRGISSNESAKLFCAVFGDLKVSHPPRIMIGDVEHSDFTSFDVQQAVDGISDLALAEFAKIASETLCPVGVTGRT